MLVRMRYLQQYYYGSFAEGGCQHPPSDGSHFANIFFNTKIDLVEWSMILIFGENAILVPRSGFNLVLIFLVFSQFGPFRQLTNGNWLRVDYKFKITRTKLTVTKMWDQIDIDPIMWGPKWYFRLIFLLIDPWY